MKYVVFMLLVLLLSVPFYLWGALFPVAGLPFGLPISFLMISVPFLLALVFVGKEAGWRGLLELGKRVGDFRRADGWALLFSGLCMPVVAVLAYWTMEWMGLPLPDQPEVPYLNLAWMLVLFWLGAIPEELGWTAVLTEPLAKAYGPLRAGVLIGAVWGAWHIIPWSWTNPGWWVMGMLVLDVLMRTAMVYAYLYGGRSLFTALVFHAMSNVAMETFPNGGSHLNPWLFSGWMALALAGVIYWIRVREMRDGK